MQPLREAPHPQPLAERLHPFRLRKGPDCYVRTPRTDDTMHSDTDFEREKWHADVELRQRELALKEREQANRDADIALKQREQATSAWRSPIVVAIFAAAVAAAGNAAVSVINGVQQRNLDTAKHNAELALETLRAKSTIALENNKAEATRILEMIKTGDPDKAASNLEFLLRSGLVTDSSLANRLADYLSSRKPGTGPALPSLAPRFAFEPSEALTGSLQATWQQLLDGYVSHLDQLGFPAPAQKVTIEINPKPMHSSWYSPSDHKIHIDPSMTSDSSIVLAVYNLYILGERKRHPEFPNDFQYMTVRDALADYLACSFLNNPNVGEVTAKGMSKPYLRTLANERKFSELSNARPADQLDAIEIVGGALWTVRAKLGREVADPILAATWLTVRWPDDDALRLATFVDALLSMIKTRTTQQTAQAVEEILKAREIPRLR